MCVCVYVCVNVCILQVIKMALIQGKSLFL